MSNVDVDLGYYKPITQEQQQFHASPARHKLLIGGMGAGKSYPASHEALFHCLDNPGHHFLVCHNTWDSLEQNIQEDFIKLCKAANLYDEKNWNKTEHNLMLRNGTLVMFRPLTLERKKFKGMHICGFLIDDPDTKKHAETIGFLYTRLRNPPRVKASRFQTIITANWEGHDWIWQTYMKDRESGDNESQFAYWVCETEKNTELPPNYIEDLAAIHDQAWMDRYIYMRNLKASIGLVFPKFDKKTHHMDKSQMHQVMGDAGTRIKIKAGDLGINHPCAFYTLETDTKAIYIHSESYHKGWGTSHVGEYLLQEQRGNTFEAIVLDPAANKTDQTSKISPRKMLLRNYGIRTVNGENAIKPGIQLMRDLFMSATEVVRIYIDTDDCPNLTKELEMYRFKEPTDHSNDGMQFGEEPIDKNNHGIDAIRYGIMRLYKHLNLSALGLGNKVEWAKKLTGLKHYTKQPGLVHRLSKDKELEQTYKQLGFSDSKIASLMGRGGYNRVGRHERLKAKYKRRSA